jgi:diguanylate cyclase (GGDEF)-like protein
MKSTAAPAIHSIRQFAQWTARHSNVGFGLMLIIVIWLAVWQLLNTERASLKRDMVQELANLSLVFEQNVVRSVGEVDRILQTIRHSEPRDGTRYDWNDVIRRTYAIDDQTLQIAVIDAQGILAASSLGLPSGTKVDLSDREHFRVHKQSELDSLFISKPVIGRASKKWSIQLTRRITKQDGRFGGVVVASLDPSHLSRTYNALSLGESGGLALIGTDDIIRAGAGFYASAIGQSLREGRQLDWQQTHIAGATFVLEEFAQQARLTAFRNVGTYPLRVLVSAPELEQTKAWTRHLRIYFGAATLATIAIIAIIVLSVRGRRRHENKISSLVRHDPLTGLANRVQLLERLNGSLKLSQENRSSALLLLDLDRFKFVNDAHGHPTGDKLLRAAAERIRKNLRQDDLAARLGGDEFAILQEHVYSEDASTQLGNRLCRILSEPFSIDGLRIEIGASIGIVVCRHHAGDNSEIMKAADLALYSAKADGRGKCKLHTVELSAAADTRRQLESQFKGSIERREFELHYQPIVMLESEQITGYEALVRWRHPERGIVPPAVFIPLAEETGFITALGTWVLHEACMEIASRPDHLKICVNVSPVQFRDKKLVEIAASAIASSGLAPERLEIEITESTLMQHDRSVTDTLQQLRDRGIKIALDDFGTGYSSLSYIHSYPIDCIKIDRSFVKDLGEKPVAAAIIRTIATLAESLGMSTIAEGVETRSQLTELSRLGCKEAQGYLFGRPLPAEQAFLPAASTPSVGASVIPAAAGPHVDLLNQQYATRMQQSNHAN